MADCANEVVEPHPGKNSTCLPVCAWFSLAFSRQIYSRVPAPFCSVLRIFACHAWISVLPFQFVVVALTVFLLCIVIFCGGTGRISTVFPLSFPFNCFRKCCCSCWPCLVSWARNIKNNICSWPSLSQLSIYALGCRRELAKGREGCRGRGTGVRTVGQLRLQRPQHLVVSYRRRRLLTPPPHPKGTYHFTRSSKSHSKQLIKLLLKLGSVLTGAYPVKLYTPSILAVCLFSYLSVNKKGRPTPYITSL